MDKFQFFGWILAEMFLKCIILVTNFHKSPSAGALCFQRHLIFDYGDLKLRDWPNYAFSNWLWQNQTLKNWLWRHFSDVIVITSQKKVTKLASHNFSILSSLQSKFLASTRKYIKVWPTNANSSLLAWLVFTLGDTKLLATWNWKSMTVY